MKKHRAARLRHRQLFVEGLESRAMLAGNITAAVRGGTLFVTGDNSDNQVVIQQTGVNQFAVVGVTGSATTVNHQAEGIVFTGNGVRNFEIDLRGGNDVLGISNNLTFLSDLQAELAAGPGGTITDVGVTADALSLRGYANIRGGTGNDAIAVQLLAGGAIFIDANAGSDAVVVEGSSTTSLVVNTDTGNQRIDAADYLRIRGVTVARGAIIANTFGGDDAILLADDSAATFVINSGVGALANGNTDFDSVSAARLVARGDVLIFGGAHVDSITVTDVDSRFFLASGGVGDDVMGFAYLDVNNATLLGEAGNDTITVDDTINAEDPTTPIVVDDTNFTAVTGLLLIDAGAGNDTVNVNGDATFNPALRNLSVLTFAGVDTVSISNVSLSGNLLIDLGSGNDDLTLDAVAVDGAINAFLGSGNDTATVSNTSAAAKARFFGGIGADTFTNGGGNGTQGVNYFLYDIETVL